MTVYVDEYKSEMWTMPSRGVIISSFYTCHLSKFLSDKRALTERGFGVHSDDKAMAYRNGFVYVLLGQKDDGEMMEEWDMCHGAR
jgi:hypothetical protein